MYIYHICICNVQDRLFLPNVAYILTQAGAVGKQEAEHTPFKKCFCPPTLLSIDLEKAEFVAFSQIYSRNQKKVINGV